MATNGNTEFTLNFRKRIKNNFRKLGQWNHFEILGVDESTPQNEIREAYLRLAKVYHPDRLPALGLEDVQKESQTIFARILEAYTVLSDGTKRQEYIASLQLKNDGIVVNENLKRLYAAELAFKKGQFFLNSGKMAEAEECFKQAYDFNPGEGQHLGYLAWCIFCDPKKDRKKTTDEVLQMLLRAGEMSPACAQIFYFLGRVFATQSDHNNAYKSFNTALALDPKHRDAEREIRLYNMREERKKSPLSVLVKRVSRQVTGLFGSTETKKRGVIQRKRKTPSAKSA